MSVGVLSLTCQMEHYKLDWHRFNLRQKMSGMPPVTAEEFERKTGAGEEDLQSPTHLSGVFNGKAAMDCLS